VTSAIEEAFSSIEEPFAFEIGSPTEEGQVATAEIAGRRSDARALQMP
jgi:hypothetical protein